MSDNIVRCNCGNAGCKNFISVEREGACVFVIASKPGAEVGICLDKAEIEKLIQLLQEKR